MVGGRGADCRLRFRRTTDREVIRWRLRAILLSLKPAARPDAVNVGGGPDPARDRTPWAGLPITLLHKYPKRLASRLPWHEALKRAGSFDKLRPYLHMGQIPACHGGLYSWPDVRQRSGPGDLEPEWWAHAYVQAGRVIFFTEEVVFGPPVQEQVFAYASSIEFDSVAFDAFFPVADLPPAEHPKPLTTQAEPAASPPAPQPAEPQQANPAPSSAPKKQSRKKAVYQSAQTVPAAPYLTVSSLKKVPDQGVRFPRPELRNAFAEEYERYMKDNPSKLICEAREEAVYAIGQNPPARAWMGVARQTANSANSASSADLAD